MAYECPLIEISGSPYERGVMYGQKAHDRIIKGVAHYSQQLNASDFGADQLAKIVSKIVPLIESFNTNLVAEMRGIAAGAQIPFEHVVLLNARTEVLQLAARQKQKVTVDSEPDGCTGLVVLPSATRDKRLIHAQNWDWKFECAETAIVLHIRRDDGPDILTFTEAGGLARAGMNASGVAITGNYLESDRDYRELGIPLALIRRHALEQDRLALALRAVYCTGKSASNNMIVSHAEGIVLNLECAPDETFQVHARDGLLVHANHWQSPVALAKLLDTGIKSTPDSLYRDLRVDGFLRPHIGRISPDDVKRSLFDDFESPWGVCRPPRPSLSSNLSATVAMIVMEPVVGTMEVAMLPALNKQFHRFQLQSDFKPASPASLS
ncbi:MAG: C45 family autoproteolytic acyltransferase/hydrolase [Burkholderiales bacterium]|jgi:isopenicillin-N N-acyltransferase-like protein|nr:C45 family peptidase [Betaproteobacteria bacterium]